MSMSTALQKLHAVALLLTLSAAGCASDGWADEEALEGDDPVSTSSELSARRARWQPPASNARGVYEGAGRYNGGRNCARGLKAGTREVGDLVDERFPSIRYEGYACRPNTANRSQLSVHGTGRALDIFASAAVGDRVAAHLVENAEPLGIQLVIWNRTIWQIRPSGATSRPYNGPNPHTDHVHAEVTSATAANGPDEPADDETTGSGEATGDDATTPTDGSGAPCSNDGVCNPGNDGSGLICVERVCTPGCRIDAQCPGRTVCVAGSCR